MENHIQYSKHFNLKTWKYWDLLCTFHQQSSLFNDQVSVFGLSHLKMKYKHKYLYTNQNLITHFQMWWFSTNRFQFLHCKWWCTMRWWGLIGIYNYKIFEKPFFILELDRSFLTLNHGCKYCILQKKLVCLLKFYVTWIQLIVLNVKSNCNLASNRNVVNHSQP